MSRLALKERELNERERQLGELSLLATSAQSALSAYVEGEVSKVAQVSTHSAPRAYKPLLICTHTHTCSTLTFIQYHQYHLPLSPHIQHPGPIYKPLLICTHPHTHSTHSHSFILVPRLLPAGDNPTQFHDIFVAHPINTISTCEKKVNLNQYERVLPIVCHIPGILYQCMKGTLDTPTLQSELFIS